ncbi:hypothetical protein K439DRAFT_1645752 [Ramaria rubella]|nr:hypothetical protein K439DRAFT_1645752 [Ramaria rubella]
MLQLIPSVAAPIACETTKPCLEQGGERISETYLEGISELECIWRFSELITLANVMLLPDPLFTKGGYCAPAIECISLLCACLGSLEDQWSLVTKYACPQSAISEITNDTASYIDLTWHHLLDWDDKGIVSPSMLQSYADALHAFGAPSWSLFGFINCTIWQTCWPGDIKYHGMKFQGVVMPNGLIVHMAGPYRAPQKDCGVLHMSQLLSKLQRHAIQPGSCEDNPPQDRYFQVYSNLAYGVSPVMISPFSGVGELTVEQREWNTAMGAVRISVEHGFGLVLQDWPFLNVFWKQKIYGNPCGLLYRVGVLLTNAHSCFVLNQTAIRYTCDPPLVEDCFHPINKEGEEGEE